MEFGLGKAPLAGILKRDPITGVLKPVAQLKEPTSELDEYVKTKKERDSSYKPTGKPAEALKLNKTGNPTKGKVRKA